MVADWLSVLPFVAIVMIVATSGSIFTPGPWYDTLRKPSWTPRDWVFPVVWTPLYIMIAAAGYLIWQAEGISGALIVWALNLVFNGAWSWIMFGQRKIGFALIDALAMLITIVLFIVLAWPVSQTAALLFVPYLAWVTTACVLNLQILQMNPDAERA